MKESLICVILAGGKGSRLDGKGKFSQIIKNKTMLEQVYSRVSKQFSYVAVNVNDKKRIINLNLRVIYDEFIDDIGPLAGIHAALCFGNKKLGKNGYVCIVPVDAPFLPNNLGERLLGGGWIHKTLNKNLSTQLTDH